MASVILEIQHPDRPHFEILRMDKDSILLGRSYSCEVCCHDQHVCPVHAKLQYDGNRWILSDELSINGTFLGRKKLCGPEILESGSQFSIGKTRITVYSPDHPVPSAVPVKTLLLSWNAMHMIIAWILLILVPVSEAIGIYLSTFNDKSFLKIFPEQIKIAMIPPIWALIWAGVGKLSGKKASFHVHLFAASSFIIMLNLVQSPLEHIIKFNCSNETICQFAPEIVLVLMIMTLLYASLVFSSNMSRRNILIASLASMVFIFSYSIVTFLNSDFEERPSFNTSVLPKEFRLVKAKTLDSFMDENQKLFKGKTGSEKNASGK